MLGNKGTGREYRDGGCRGGQDQFKWEDVKADAYRENYLGHSQHAPVGRWQKGKDILWYTRKHGDAKEHVTTQLKLPEGGEAARRVEIAAIKAYEEDMLAQQLGLAVKRRRVGGEGATRLEQAEVDALLARGESTREQTDVERVSGLGAAPSKRHEHVAKASPAEKDAARLRAAAARLQADDGHYGHGGGGEPFAGFASGGGGGGGERTKKELKREKKERKKEKKREKKEKKRAKKEAKKASSKKDAPKRPRHDSSSSSGSSSDSDPSR